MLPRRRTPFCQNQAEGIAVWLTYWVFGYSAGRPLPEVWSIIINGKEYPAPMLLQGETDFGPRWAGEEEALDRLILGRTRSIVESAVKKTGWSSRAQ